MSESVKIISPVDGSVYAERPVARDADIDAAVRSARAALPEWKAVPVSERARYMLAFLDALLAMNDAWNRPPTRVFMLSSFTFPRAFRCGA